MRCLYKVHITSTSSNSWLKSIQTIRQHRDLNQLCEHILGAHVQFQMFHPTTKLFSIVALYRLYIKLSYLIVFFFSFWSDVEPSPLLLRPLLAYCTSPRWCWMMMNVQQRLSRKTEVGGEKFPQCRFVHHKYHITWHGLEHGPPRWKAGN
jgi:hypothetical protein